MKKFLAIALSLMSMATYAAAPTFQNLTKDDVENVSKEFGANFAHTTVSAPETTGLWGVEVGVVGGTTSSPHLKDVIDQASPGDGKDFKKMYHAGLMARAHFPLDLFVEGSVLPNRTISSVTVANKTFGLGWNAGSFFNLPLDLAAGINFSDSDVSFTQDQIGAQVAVNSKIKLNTKTRILWVGVSKQFLFFTPYLKVGKAQIDSDVNVDTTATSTIFTGTNAQSMSVKNNGGFLSLGANVQVFFLRLGFEATQIAAVRKATAKLSFSF